MSKLIILSLNKQDVLTFEEVYHKYQGLLRNRIAPWLSTYEYDEIFQEAVIGLWVTYEKYDAVYGWTFLTLAYKVIDVKLLNYHRKHKSKLNNEISLNKIISDSGDTELQDFIGKDETFTNEITDKLFFEKVFKKIPKQSQQWIFYYLSGYKQAEIAELENVNQSAVSRKIQAAFKKLKGLYLKEMAS